MLNLVACKSSSEATFLTKQLRLTIVACGVLRVNNIYRILTKDDTTDIGIRGVWGVLGVCSSVIGCQDGTPQEILTKKMFVPPTADVGQRGGVEVLGRCECCVGWKGGRWGSAVYYLSCRVGVSCSIGFHMCSNWYFPMFLFSEGSLTQMNMASLMFIVLPCGSLCMM